MGLVLNLKESGSKFDYLAYSRECSECLQDVATYPTTDPRDTLTDLIDYIDSRPQAERQAVLDFLCQHDTTFEDLIGRDPTQYKTNAAKVVGSSEGILPMMLGIVLAGIHIAISRRLDRMIKTVSARNKSTDNIAYSVPGSTSRLIMHESALSKVEDTVRGWLDQLQKICDNPTPESIEALRNTFTKAGAKKLGYDLRDGIVRTRSSSFVSTLAAMFITGAVDVLWSMVCICAVLGGAPGLGITLAIIGQTLEGYGMVRISQRIYIGLNRSDVAAVDKGYTVEAVNQHAETFISLANKFKAIRAAKANGDIPKEDAKFVKQALRMTGCCVSGMGVNITRILHYAGDAPITPL